MTDRYGKTAACGLLWMASCAFGLAHAQPADEPKAELGEATSSPPPMDASVPNAPEQEAVLALAVGPDVVDREALRRALEVELGVAVEDAGNAPAYMPKLSVTALPNGNVEVALSSRTVPRSVREFVLSAQIPAERVEMVTLIAANLIRNEAAAILPELRPAPVEPVPVVAAAPPSPPSAISIDPCSTTPPREFGIDLAPGVGASSNQRGRTATRAVSLALAGSLHDRLHGFELAWTGANIVRKSVCGVQISGGANVSWGPVMGAQVGMFNLVKGGLTGVQLGVAGVVTIGDLDGVQAGIVAINHGRLTGFQLSLAGYARNGVEGVQGGLLNLSFGNIDGVQLGVANFTNGALDGAQFSVANYAGGTVDGVQFGVANVGLAKVDGAQLGVLNVAGGEVHGVQVGLANYAERSSASIGLLSIVRRGRTSVDLWGAIDSSLAFASVTHGGKYVHNILGVGLRANPGDTRAATVYGLGVRALSNRWLRLDIDLLGQNVYTTDVQTKGVSMVATVRVPVTFMVVRGLGVMVAPSYNFSIIDKDESRELNNFASTSIARGDLNVRGWVGATLGVRYEFDHGV